MKKPKLTRFELELLCIKKAERIPGFYELPEDEQNRILRALWEIAQE